MQIQAILWDIDGTLLNFPAAQRAAIFRCFAEFHLGTCNEQMLAEYSEINHRYWGQLERGEITKQEVLEGRFREFFARYDLPQEIVPDFNARYQIYLGDTVCFEPYALEVVSALAGHVRQYAATNGTKVAQTRKLASSGLGNLLDGIFISEDVGAEKPSAAFYDTVLQQIGLRGRQVLMVGDSLSSDMQGGRNAGLRCCWYNPSGKPQPDQPVIDDTISDLRQVLQICGQPPLPEQK